jgi:hypothetical protein
MLLFPDVRLIGFKAVLVKLQSFYDNENINTLFDVSSLNWCSIYIYIYAKRN